MKLENRQTLNQIIRRCLETNEIYKRAKLIQYLNKILPADLKIQLPMLVTNNSINKILYSLEERIS